MDFFSINTVNKMKRAIQLTNVRGCSFSAYIGRPSSAKSHSLAAQYEEQNFINGMRCIPENYQTCKVENNINPATGQVIGQFYNSDEQEVEKAIKNAKDAFESWSQSTASDRSQFLRRAGRIISQRVHEIAKLETLDSGN